MKLFDPTENEKREIIRLALWHLAYMLLIAVFFSVIYYWGFFKSHPILREGNLFTVVAPLATVAFAALSPWRKKWLGAVRDLYARLEGEPLFCIMAILVFGVGFYMYSVFLWGLGALGPSLFYM